MTRGDVRLTPREEQVVACVCRGLLTRQIALTLQPCVTEGSVRQYIYRIADKLPPEFQPLPPMRRILVWKAACTVEERSGRHVTRVLDGSTGQDIPLASTKT